MASLLHPVSLLRSILSLALWSTWIFALCLCLYLYQSPHLRELNDPISLEEALETELTASHPDAISADEAQMPQPHADESIAAPYLRRLLSPPQLSAYGSEKNPIWLAMKADWDLSPRFFPYDLQLKGLTDWGNTQSAWIADCLTGLSWRVHPGKSFAGNRFCLSELSIPQHGVVIADRQRGRRFRLSHEDTHAPVFLKTIHSRAPSFVFKWIQAL